MCETPAEGHTHLVPAGVPREGWWKPGQFCVKVLFFRSSMIRL
jgi:hypothetical protein